MAGVSTASRRQSSRSRGRRRVPRRAPLRSPKRSMLACSPAAASRARRRSHRRRSGPRRSGGRNATPGVRRRGGPGRRARRWGSSRARRAHAAVAIPARTRIVPCRAPRHALRHGGRRAELECRVVQPQAEQPDTRPDVAVARRAATANGACCPHASCARAALSHDGDLGPRPRRPAAPASSRGVRRRPREPAARRPLAGAVKACGEGAVLSHFAAAALWGFVTWDDRFPEVTVAGHGDRGHRGIRAAPHRPRLDARRRRPATRASPSRPPRARSSTSPRPAVRGPPPGGAPGAGAAAAPTVPQILARPRAPRAPPRLGQRSPGSSPPGRHRPGASSRTPCSTCSSAASSDHPDVNVPLVSPAAA